VRPAEPSDLEAIMRIDEKLTAQTRKDYWRTRLDIAALRPPWMSSVAEMDGRLVGFLRSAELQSICAALPGYDASRAGAPLRIGPPRRRRARAPGNH